eukprot:TRINITY_DN87880_c0_g1_i1.p1 TRINITY_DN87880_c0_g1~~TRINITY_DN87880_c0_g1_i1.p1  ORF type:complete len:704 (-),score=108.79 TRINITY_DN87880_c0_g1_i1:123-2234(-)
MKRERRRSSALKFASEPPNIHSKCKATLPPVQQCQSLEELPDLDELQPLDNQNAGFQSQRRNSLSKRRNSLSQRRNSQILTWPRQAADARDIYLLRHTYSKGRRIYEELMAAEACQPPTCRTKLVNAAIAISRGAGTVLRNRARCAKALLATANREGERVEFCKFLQQELNLNVEGSGDILDETIDEDVTQIFCGFHKLQVTDYSKVRRLLEAAINEQQGAFHCLLELKTFLKKCSEELYEVQEAITNDPELSAQLVVQEGIDSHGAEDAPGKIIEKVTSMKARLGYQRKFDKAAQSSDVLMKRQENRSVKFASLEADDKEFDSDSDLTALEGDDKHHNRSDDVIDKNVSKEDQTTEKGEQHETSVGNTGFLLDLARGSSGLVRKTRKLNSTRLQGVPSQALQRRDHKSRTHDFEKQRSWAGRKGSSSGLALPSLEALKLALRKHGIEDDDGSDDDDGEEGKDRRVGDSPKPFDGIQSLDQSYKHQGGHFHRASFDAPQDATRASRASFQALRALQEATATELSAFDEPNLTRPPTEGHSEAECRSEAVRRRHPTEEANDLGIVVGEELLGAMDSSLGTVDSSLIGTQHSLKGVALRSEASPESKTQKRFRALRRRLLRPLQHDWRPPSPWGIGGWEWAPADLANRPSDVNVVPTAPSTQKSRMAATLPHISSSQSGGEAFARWRFARPHGEKSLLKVLFPIS